MRILFDTNVILDLLLARQPFWVGSANLFAKVEYGDIEGYLCGTTVTTIHYLLAKNLDSQQAKDAVSRLLSLFEIATVSRSVLSSALSLNFGDYEDAVLHEAARLAHVDAIVTRNLADFSLAQLPVYDPPALLALLHARRGR